MSFISSFLDGESYGAADLNEVTKRFVTAGIEDPFTDGVAYNVKKLNDLNVPITERGVALSDDTCLQVINSGGAYYVSPGTAFFANGSTLTVTANHTITVAAGVKNYVYLLSNENLTSNTIEVSTTAPDAASDVVKLAEIEANGGITDKRCYATGKQGMQYQNNEDTFKTLAISDTVVFASGVTTVTTSHDLECTALKFLCFVVWEHAFSNGKYAEPDAGGTRVNDRSYLHVWLPPMHYDFGLSHSTGNDHQGYAYGYEKGGSEEAPFHEYTAAQIAAGSRDFWCYGDRQVGVWVTITPPQSGTEWTFTYTSYRSQPATALSITTDYKLFYI